LKRSDIRPYTGPDRELIEDEMVRHLQDFVSGARATNASGQSFYKCTGPAVWIERIMMFLKREHRAKPDEGEKHTLNDLRSEARLRVIFDSNLRRFYRNLQRGTPVRPLKYL